MLNATGQISPITEKLRVSFHIVGLDGNIDFKVAKNIKYDMVLGMDFAILFKIEVYAAGHEWRVRDNRKKLHQFSNNDNKNNIQLYGECADIVEINLDQKKKIDRVLKECLKNTN